MAEHTPGPWHASSYDGWEWEGHCIRDAHGQIIAKLALNVPGDANVRLIAAAPELLAALRVVMEHVDDLHGVDRGALAHPSWHWFKAARAAIATAFLSDSEFAEETRDTDGLFEGKVNAAPVPEDETRGEQERREDDR